jgi:multidrug efflux pump subunit AcrA (membrane-fusion protein)
MEAVQMYVRLLPIPVLSAALVLTAVAILVFPSGDRGSGHFVSTAHAESNVKVQENIRRGIKRVESLIERWRRGDAPEGIVKTNGRIEATEIDVSPKYAGRLESVMVNEGDDVKAGQVIARISSPEYQAQLRTAQANVLVASSTLASAEAKIVQAQADLTYATDDLARGKRLLDGGWLPKQQYDQRVNRLDSDQAAVTAAEKQREAAKSVVRGEKEGVRDRTFSKGASRDRTFS